MGFRWNAWNTEHVLDFVLDEDGSTYILHARPLTEREKRRYRRQRR